MKPFVRLMCFNNRGGIKMAEKRFAGLTYEQTVIKYKKAVGSLCLVRLKNYADAEDCSQNVFARL